MGRATRRLGHTRELLRRFDRFGVVSTKGDPLVNLLNIEWSGRFARAVLTMSPRTHPDLQFLFGTRTISASALVRGYEPALQALVEDLFREGYGRTPAHPLHEPLFCCALFGWKNVCATLLEHGANPLLRGEHGMLPIDCARSHGWSDVASQLDRRDALEVEGDGNKHEEFEWDADKQEKIDELLCPAAADGTIDASCLAWNALSLPRCHITHSEMRIAEVDGRELRTRRFESEFFYAKVPVMIKHGAGSIPALQWRPQDFLAGLSDTSDSCPAHASEHHPQLLSSIPYPEEWMPADLAAEATSKGGIHDILRGDLGYFFAEVESASILAQMLDKDVNLPRVLPTVFREENQMLPQFSFGQSGTGAPWHWHQDAFNICILGERMWYLRPPAEALMSRQPVREGVPKASESFCVLQRPGDIVYIPELWGHCVINCTLSAAVSLEFGAL